MKATSWINRNGPQEHNERNFWRNISRYGGDAASVIEKVVRRMTFEKSAGGRIRVGLKGTDDLKGVLKTTSRFMVDVKTHLSGYNNSNG